MKALFTSFCVAALLGAAAPTPLLAQTAPAARAQTYLAQHQQQLGLLASDVREPIITDAYTESGSGITHVYLQQQYQGLPVLGTEMGLHFDAQGNLLTHTGAFVANLAAKAPAVAAAVSGPTATLAAAGRLHLTPASLQITTAGQARQSKLTLQDAALSTEEIPVELAYAAQPDGSVRLVWEVVLHPPHSLAQWRVLVDATTGQVIAQHDRNTREKLVAPAPTAAQQLATPATAARATADGASYTVFAVPSEGPNDGPRTTLTNPADATASPFGWHDTNGVAGPEFTDTRGNNAQAYALVNGAPYYTSGGSSLSFNKPYDITKTPVENQDAGIVNLFYVNNVMHDVFHYYGFDEASGNFQTRNYTGKGKGGDPVRANAQDGTGTYNATFTPSVDGKLPSMNMFLWPAPEPTRLKVTAPVVIADVYPAQLGAIGPKLTGTLSGKLVLVDDGTATPSLGCVGPLANAAAIKGNIALIDRGSCTFVEKVGAAQAAGAIAVVVINNEPARLLTMSGDEQFNIPGVVITLETGNAIKDQLKANQTVTVDLYTQAKTFADRDGSFDNVIIAHEYGHGISTRLTGGASRIDCLISNVGTSEAPITTEQMGEGWSDYFALWLTTKPTDTALTPRSVGNYVLGQQAQESGIRNKIFSTDLTVNNYTYAIVGNPYNEVHDIGEVWTTMLWDLNWAMVERYGYSTDLYRGTAGNNKAMQLVMQGLKLQKCQPGFVDGRDAILAADRALFKSANQDLIWRVFARRGLGVNAVQGSSISVFDNKAGFALPAGLATKAALSATSVEVYPNPANDVLTVRTFGLSAAPVRVEVLSVLGATLRTQDVPAARAQAGTTLDLSQLASGLYLVRISTPEGSLTKKVMVRH